MARRVHFVGSLPPELNPDPYSGMNWILRHSHGMSLTTLPWDSDDRWIVRFLLNLKERHEVLVPLREGDWSDYDKPRTYTVARGAKLQPEQLSMLRAGEIRAAVAAYRQLLHNNVIPGSPGHQVSLPSPLDLSIFTFGQRPEFLRHVSTFASALAAEASDLHSTDGDVLVWQIEAPSVLVFLHKMPSVIRPLVARLLAKQMAAFIARLPQDAGLLLHLCYGNLNDTALVAPKDLTGVDVFLNTLRKALRHQGRPLPPVHIPAAYGSQPPSQQASFYAALAKVHPDWPLIAGVVDEQQPDSSRHGLELFETAAQRTSYAVATSCGLGRHSPADAVEAASLTSRLATHPKQA